jgi:hypothetical protein
MIMKLLIILLLPVLFTTLFFSHNIHIIYAQESLRNYTSLPNNFLNIENMEIGVKINYPEDWTIQYTKNNNSKVISGFFQALIESENETLKSIGEDLNQMYPTDADKYQYFLEYRYNNCGFVTDCRLIGDAYFRSYMLDSEFNPFVSIFDYVPSLSILSPIENSTDNFIENVKVASFELPHNSTLAEFTDYLYEFYYVYYYYLDRRVPNDLDYNCRSNVSGYLGCEISYTFIVGNNIEEMQYKTWQFFTQKNDRVYLISYNILRDSDLNYLELVETILKSFRIL